MNKYTKGCPTKIRQPLSYFADHGIRNSIVSGSREGDIEKVLENIIYNELIRQGFKVYVGQLQASEIDFVCEKTNGGRIYIPPWFPGAIMKASPTSICANS